MRRTSGGRTPTLSPPLTTTPFRLAPACISLPNVIGTGDQACSVDGVPERLIAMGTESLAAFAKGKSMPQATDLVLGY